MSDRVLRIMAWLALGTLWLHQPAAAQQLVVEVRVDGLRSTQGSLLVAAHAERTSFPGNWDGASAMQSAPAAGPSVTVQLKLPAAGRYALIVVHDEDANGRMTKNLLGLPREGYATGNNPNALEFPRFDRSTIEFRESRRVELQLRYP